MSVPFWRHAIVERLIKGTDECVKAAVMLVSDEKGHVRLLLYNWYTAGYGESIIGTL